MASKRARRCCIALIVVLALYATYRLTLYLMVQARLNEIRKQGYPATLAELDKWYPQPPPGENAADQYLDAFRHFAPAGGVHRGRPLPEEGEDETIVPPCAEVLHFRRVDTNEVAAVASNADALALLHAIQPMKACRYPIDFSVANEHRRMPHLNPIRHADEFLTTEAMMRADEGKIDAAVVSLEDSVKLAQSLANEPLIISQVVRFYCNRRNIGVLERLLSRTGLPDDALVRLAPAFISIDNPACIRRAIIGERCDTVNTIQHMFTFIPLWDFIGFQDRFLLAYLDQSGRLLDAAHGDYPAGLDVANSLEERFDDSIQADASALVAGLAGISTRDAEMCADSRCAVTALCVERYRLSHGELPHKLDELVPLYLKTVPTDPFDGQPLRYRKLANGYVVYSVCKDGHDDGGDELKDITFTVER